MEDISDQNEFLSIYQDEIPPAQILSYLYLGDINNASNSREIMELNIKYLLNASYPQTKDYFAGKYGLQYLHIELYDTANDELEPHFQSTFDFINKARKEQASVLVYCKSGNSRSVSFVCAYLMKYYGLSIEQALMHIRLNRSSIKPNDGFIKRLICFEMDLKMKPALSGKLMQDEEKMMQVFNKTSKVEKEGDDPFLHTILPLSTMITNTFELDFVDFFFECFKRKNWEFLKKYDNKSTEVAIRMSMIQYLKSISKEINGDFDQISIIYTEFNQIFNNFKKRFLNAFVYSIQNLNATNVQKQLATSIHTLLLDKNKKAHEICTEIKEKILPSFDIISEISTFEETYLNLFSDRFIYSISRLEVQHNFFLEKEQEVASLFKNLGGQFKSLAFQLEGMLREIASSEEFCEKFLKEKTLPFQFSLTLISSSKWPKRLILPKESEFHSQQADLWRGISFQQFQSLKSSEFPNHLNNFYESFIPFYSDNQAKKRLVFLNHLGSAEFVLSFNKQNFRIVSSPDIMFLLMHFNSDDSLDYDRISEILQVPKKRVDSILKILLKSGKKTDSILVKQENTFIFNPNFKSKNKIIKLKNV
eukprot:TRINITY_DN10127_c0_g1_i1.p1 TRINITY_DN10127_c0_g1~~TRINITY_DN10127_c0_g1_i1.p1  ORF type:complete len:601 (-),score=144.57 TRINITY_DN10127_c0_g1_i1:90-1862(-)